MNKYVVDANVFIQAKNDHYGMDFCPGFWEWLIDGCKKGKVCSIKAICDELSQTPTDDEDEDELSKWVKTQGNGLFLPHDQLMTDQLPVVAQWAKRLYGKSGFHKMTVPSHFGGIHADSEFAPQSIQ